MRKTLMAAAAVAVMAGAAQGDEARIGPHVVDLDPISLSGFAGIEYQTRMLVFFVEAFGAEIRRNEDGLSCAVFRSWWEARAALDWFIALHPDSMLIDRILSSPEDLMISPGEACAVG